LDRLEDNKFAIKEGQAVLTNIITVRGTEDREIGFGNRGGSGQSVKEEFSIGVLMVGRSPIELSRDGPSSRDGINKRPSDELGWWVSRVDGSKEMGINKVIDKMGAKAEGATSREGESIIRGIGSRR
jgi:hypothetical protein